MTTPAYTAHEGCSCGHLQDRSVRRAAAAQPRLTKRQREIVLAWPRYGTKERVAQELYVTPSTVKTHIQRVRESYANVGRPAGTKFELFIRAVQDGLIDIGDDDALRRFYSDHDDR